MIFYLSALSLALTLFSVAPAQGLVIPCIAIPGITTCGTSSSSTNTGSTSTTTVSTTAQYGATSIGCFSDILNGLSAPWVYVSGTGMTQPICANYCGAQAFRFAGISNQNQCQCSNTRPTQSASGCTLTCPGNTSTSCGGSGRSSVVENVNIPIVSTSTSSSSTSTARTSTTSTQATTSSTSLAVSTSTQAISTSSQQQLQTTSTAQPISTTTQASSSSMAQPSSTTSAGQSSVTFAFGGSSVGCYQDDLGFGGSRPLNSYSFSSSSMTNELCANTCGVKGWKFSAVEYGQECYCGPTKPTTTSTSCNMACSGNSGETCGGSWAMSLFDNTAISGSATGSLSASYSSIGCFADSVSARTFTEYSTSSSSMTVELCATTCSQRNLAFSGVEYGSECRCASYAPVTTSNQCNMPCSGSNSQICGGPNAMSVIFNSAIATTNGPTCASLPTGYAVCAEGQRVSSGKCVAA